MVDEDLRPGRPEAAREAASPAVPSLVSRRALGIAAALIAMVAVIVVDAVFIVSSVEKREPSFSASAPIAARASLSAAPPSVPTGVPSAEPVLANVPAPKFPSPAPEGPTQPSTRRHAAPHTVQEAADWTCSTSSVDGLSRQIIRQSRCIDPGAFVAVPSRPNLVTKPNVFLFLEAPARAHLLKALDENRKLTMTVNSSLRTVAQQYLLWRWYSNKRCGIHLATPPGESNHETGLALDIAEAPAWRSALAAQDFHWLGAIDNMHFDYKGPNAVSHAKVDVKAFEELWNANHPDDRIADQGRFTPQTEKRLKKSPARGFSHGPHCR